MNMNKYLPTGNEMVSLPKINEGTAAIEDIAFLSMQYKGLIELRGDEEKPLLTPFIEGIGSDAKTSLSDFEWSRVSYWIPQLTASFGKNRVRITYLTPVKERGFAVQLSLTAEEPLTVKWGMRGIWGSTYHCINEDKMLEGTTHCYDSGWNHSIIFDYRLGVPVFAFAPMCDCEINSSHNICDNKIDYCLFREDTFEAGETKTVTFFWGLGFEEVAAATSAKEMLRRGFAYEFNKTTDYLNKRIKKFHTEKLTEIYNTNLFFCTFYSTGITLDTEELVCATSRSTRYYVSAAYWDRDTLLWAFPAILDSDDVLAKKILTYIFTRQSRNIGVHSRYIDGVVLEPGFELDELMAPILALDSYVKKTGDRKFLEERFVTDTLDSILETLSEMKHEEVALYETFLQPTDDEIVYPYLTYNNVLVWKALAALSEFSPKYSYLKAMSDETRAAILEHCIKEDAEGRPFFSWSLDLGGHFNIYDEPPGSLQLLPYLGFCDFSDEVWKNSVAMIRGKDYRFSFAGTPIAEIGCEHAPYPWILSLCNSLLAGFEEQAFSELEIVKMDNGIACESVDAYTGECTTGEAFATCAGFLCHSMLVAENKRK